MKLGRIQMILVPRDVSGRIRTFRVSPSLIRVLLILVIACICSVPIFETGVRSLIEEVNRLEVTKETLEAEISRLQYVKTSLRRLEEKDERLRGYFGMDEYRALEEFIGVGGNSDVLEKEIVLNDGAISRKETPRRNPHEKIETLATNYDILNQLAEKQTMTWENTPSIVPVTLKTAKISSRFGWRVNPFTNRREFHAGIDIIGPEGAIIIAPASGMVLTSGYDQWLGNYLVLAHGGGIKTIYGHLKEISVKKGKQVKRGAGLAIMGNTGLSTSRHLHYAVIQKDRAVDPMQYILDVKG